MNVLRQKPVEDKRHYMFVARLIERMRTLTNVDTARIARIWAIVHAACQAAPAPPAPQSPAAELAAEEPLSTPAVEVPQSGNEADVAAAAEHLADLPMWLTAEWGDNAADRTALQSIVARIHLHGDMNGFDGAQRDVWSRLRRRRHQASGPRPRDRVLPEGLAPLIGYIERLPDEMPAYQEKISKRKGSVHDGADEYFLQGRWDLTSLDAAAVQVLNNSMPVLSGGQELLRAALAKHRPQRTSGKKRSKEVAGQQAEQRRARRVLNPRLPGNHRRRLPDSLRVLYGASEEAEHRLFSFLERAQAADAYLQSFHFASCDYCKVGWFGSAQKPPVELRQLSAVSKWNFLLAEPDEWPTDDGRRICRRCLEEVVLARKQGAKAAAVAASSAAEAGGLRAASAALPAEPQLFCAPNDMDIDDTHPEIDALTFFEEEILAPVQPVVRVYTLYGTGLTEMRGHVANWAQSGPQFVREIPARAKDLNILLIRRFPRDANRKQRVPFIASPARLEAALNRLEGKLGTPPHLGFCQHDIPINRRNLQDYDDGKEPQGMQVQVVDQGLDFIIDQHFFASWMGSTPDEQGCFQVNVLLRAHLDLELEDSVESDAAEEEEEEEEVESTAGGVSDPWAACAWRRICRAVAHAEAEQEPAERETPGGDDDAADADATHAKVAVHQRLKDVALARWLESTIQWNEQSSLLDVLRDELTTVQEMEALQHPVEASGTWAPDELLTKKTEDQLVTEFQNDLNKTFGSLIAPDGAVASDPADDAAAPSSAEINAEQKEFDTAGMTRQERASLERYGAARLAGAPIVRPPQAADTRILLREDMPFYMSLGFLKIFQTGRGDFWAFEQRRRDRGLPVSLWDWFQHVLRHRSGRGLRHPRFFYFAVNTLLRNKAVRGKSYFVRRSIGHQAYEDFTPQQLLGKSKAQMIRILCAYETKMPGSAAEKLAQRDDLEAMLQQLETESEAKARSELPGVRRELQRSLTAAQSMARADATGPSEDMAEAHAQAMAELGMTAGDAPSAEEGGDVPAVAASGAADVATTAEVLRNLIRQHGRIRRCVEQRGEVPVHFITLTTAIYHWQDLAQWLREYKESTTALRGGRQDPLEPGEDKVPEEKRLVLQYPGIVAWFCALKLELLVNYVEAGVLSMSP
jgi:hypothetical protein